MSTRLIHRPARTTRPPAAPTDRVIEAPPNLPEGTAGGIAMSLLPVAGVMSSVVMMTVVRNSQFAALGALILLVTVIGSLALVFSQRGKAQRTRRTQREAYLAYLEELREELSAEERERRERAGVLDPPPSALYDIVRDPARLWERRRGDEDFLRVRVGTGETPVRELRIADPGSTVLTPPDRFMLNEASALRDRFRTGTELPLTVPLDRVGDVSVIGPREDCLRLVRALLTQTAAAHAPDDVAVALAVPGERMADWEWAKWLPHLLDQERFDGPVAARRIAPSLPQLARALGAELRRRASYAAEVRRGLSGPGALGLTSRLLVIADGHGADAVELPLPDEAVGLREMGVTVLHLLERRVQEPGRVAVRITVDGDRTHIEDLRGDEPVGAHGTTDAAGTPFAEGLARMLAPLRLSAESLADAPLSGPVDFAELLGIDDVARLDLDRLWAPRAERAFLRVPIGVGDSREPVLLDLKESSELGMGPHGLCVGATGSGKSELLRTLVLALAATHPPQDLALVLVDYKGGATFAPFAGLPHVAGVITNLENQAGLVERVHASLAGEVKRRQQVLKDAGNVADIGDYAALRADRRPDLAPLPHLFVVIDEFGELLTAKPDFIDLFLSIGRIGRSIGVHLLLSSQRIEGGRLKGLDTYLSYRLGLRTFSADESRTVLDTADAFQLPPLPGFGYLKVDTSHYERFKAGYVSGGYRGPVRRSGSGSSGSLGDGGGDGESGPLALEYPAFNTLGGPERGPAEPAARRRETGPTEMGVMVEQLERAAVEPVRQIWLPPLPAALTLDAVAGPLEVGERGTQLARRRGPLQIPLGLLDDPTRQWQGQWFLDLTLAGGHAAVIGGPQSGKTTLLRTLVLALALTHTPREVGIYGLDLAGGGLQALGGLPHVGGVAGRADRERAARTVEEVRAMLALREELFRVHGIDSVEQLRARHAAGGLPELASADIVLVVDGFGALRDDFEELDDAVVDILRRGSGYGIHVVAAMFRWNDVRIATQSAFGTRVELRLNDPSESSVERRLAETLTPDEPGRVLTDGKLFAQAALPRTDGRPDPDGLGPFLEHTARTVRATWGGERAQPVRVLPQLVQAEELPGPAAEPHRVPIGLDQSALEPVLLDLFAHDQHLLIMGDSECGKTSLLRTLANGLVERYREEELVLAVMDPRRGLRGAVPEEFLGGYAYNTKLAAGLSAGIATELERRLPDESASLAALEPGSWGSGPRIVVLVDDYDVLTTAGQNPLAPFLPYLPSAVDIGLHFVVTRRVAGASRGVYEPLVQGLRESGATALVMAGDRSEGQLFPGVYAAHQPPGRGVLVRRGRPNRLIQTVYTAAR
ncbi:type VII secretion protein EccC [Streptomyces clavuligerus]|uniref:Putative FtsK/SpoIIIE family protein n=1 Tax=Streptomyces clavuligerus TaxID=1901 RepID=E2Q4G5_STRCL|nr:type VII secretion protein EccC [Streptomyces clavuligerus]ANW20094.1 type VII secretion protein EccC [Streptomyces clavuligerus]AXU14720.1 type VII secretion protein EccC [Streptomyces clavuligerus]EFG07003.1 Putative FtsK/SpoIIIE family protein [Streptomyces clavuligerus]MBY6304744.1 type VII secretion protein EccC [Streptomyces clavuligerus]QCS07489.1 type VII secretion protein EccC [Streptomyces clavuligerus]